MARLFLHILRLFIDVPWVKLLLMYILQLLKLYVGCCEGSAGHPQKGISDVPKGTMGIALVESCSGCLLRSVLIFRWSSKSVSAYSRRLCSFLCPVIAVILSFDSPPFCSFLIVACRSVCDRDQEFWLVKIVLDRLITPFRGSWSLDFTANCSSLWLPNATASVHRSHSI